MERVLCECRACAVPCVCACACACARLQEEERALDAAGLVSVHTAGHLARRVSVSVDLSLDGGGGGGGGSGGWRCGCGLEHADQCSRLARIPIAGLDRVERVTARVVRKRAVFQHLVLGPLSQRVYLGHHLLLVRSVHYPFGEPLLALVDAPRLAMRANVVGPAQDGRFRARQHGRNDGTHGKRQHLPRRRDRRASSGDFPADDASPRTRVCQG